MSKKSYLVECYTCEHNGQETCNGCKTLLVGDDEPYGNWQLRKDLETKDQKIAELEQQLAENKKKIEELKGERLQFYNDGVRRTQVINGVHFDIEQLLVFSEYVEHEKWVISNRDKEIEELNKQLLYKEKEISILKSQLCLSSISQSIDQDKIWFAIDKLVGVQKYIDDKAIYIEEVDFGREIKDFIDNQIEELKKEKLKSE